MIPDWFTELRPVAYPRATLFCFHFGGGSSGAFRGWAKYLPADIKLVGVDLPGRAARFGEPLLSSTEQVVKGLLTETKYLSRQTPFIFYGHSLGALIAYELTRRLERLSFIQPCHLIVSGRGAPHLPLRGAPIHELPNEEFIDELKKYQGTPEDILRNQELMDIFLPILRADFRISETYQYQEDGPIKTNITVLGGNQDTTVDVNTLHEWKRHTKGTCTVRTFTGGHFFINLHEAEIVALLAAPTSEKMAYRGD